MTPTFQVNSAGSAPKLLHSPCPTGKYNITCRIVNDAGLHSAMRRGTRQSPQRHSSSADDPRRAGLVRSNLWRASMIQVPYNGSSAPMNKRKPKRHSLTGVLVAGFFSATKSEVESRFRGAGDEDKVARFVMATQPEAPCYPALNCFSARFLSTSEKPRPRKKKERDPSCSSRRSPFRKKRCPRRRGTVDFMRTPFPGRG